MCWVYKEVQIALPSAFGHLIYGTHNRVLRTRLWVRDPQKVVRIYTLREDWHAPCARMTRKNREDSIFFSTFFLTTPFAEALSQLFFEPLICKLLDPPPFTMLPSSSCQPSLSLLIFHLQPWTVSFDKQGE